MDNRKIKHIDLLLSALELDIYSMYNNPEDMTIDSYNESIKSINKIRDLINKGDKQNETGKA